MATADILKNDLIDKLLAISDKDYLSALNKLVDSSALKADVVYLSAEQILLLKLSDNDIEANKLISQSQLDKEDLLWLKNHQPTN